MSGYKSKVRKLNKNQQKMNKKTVSISLPQIEGVELKNATVDLKKGVVIAEYGGEDIEKDISEIAVNFRECNRLSTRRHSSTLFTQLKNTCLN